MALAMNVNDFTLPHNIQEFRMNMGFLSALWANDGDCVLVDDVAYAVKAAGATGCPHADVLFLTDSEIKNFLFDAVEAWGWDMSLRHRLQQAGIPLSLMPDDQELHSIRCLANRTITTDVLMAVSEGLGAAVCGKSFFVNDTDTIERLLSSYGRIVLKSLWSSSGRGVRYVDGVLSANVGAWVDKTISKQGGLMVEPHYTRIKDFAMEFYSDGNGLIAYQGLSIFHTEKGNYAGNIIATEDEKLRMLSQYVDMAVIDSVRSRIMVFFSTALRRRYKGLFGVDMMIVVDGSNNRFKIHPCVEVNFRRTMGHVANAITATEDDPVRFLRIFHDVNYTLRLVTPDPGYVKVI